LTLRKSTLRLLKRLHKLKVTLVLTGTRTGAATTTVNRTRTVRPR
jgi:hypothetical protein